jgi:hypothetical protein
MSHNIQIEKYGANDNVTVLHAVDTDRTYVRIGIGPEQIGIQTFEESGRPGPIVGVKGEDLFALRELLNEMPEEAFVRPADPVYVTMEEPLNIGATVRAEDGHVYVRTVLWNERGHKAWRVAHAFNEAPLLEWREITDPRPYFGEGNL